MLMLHATPVRNLRNIWCRGLRASRSKGAARTVWLAAGLMWGEAIRHASRRHGVHPTLVVVLEIDVPRSWLRKGRRKGLWHTGGRDIPPERIKYAGIYLRTERPSHAPA